MNEVTNGRSASFENQISVQNTPRRPLEIQDRWSWYTLHDFLHSCGLKSRELHFKDPDLIHIGGTALYGHMLKAFGPRTVFFFRGTHDLDLLSFTPGSVNRVLDVMLVYPHERKHKDLKTGISGYEVHKSFNSLDQSTLKRTITVDLMQSNNPGALKSFEVDVFEPNSFNAEGSPQLGYNERLFTPDRLIFDPPQKLDIDEYNGLLVVPSLRDNFIIKTDVVNFSRSGLRDKDKMDILVTFAICDQLKIDYEYLIRALIDDAVARKDQLPELRKKMSETNYRLLIKKIKNGTVAKLEQLESLLSNPSEIKKKVSPDYPFFPNERRLADASKLVKQSKRQLSGLAA